MLRNKYFYCYETALHKLLHYDNGIPFVCAAIHERTGNKFWLYERDPKVNQLIKDYVKDNK